MFVFISLSSRVGSIDNDVPFSLVGRREKGDKQMWSFLNFFFPQNEFINEESQNLRYHHHLHHQKQMQNSKQNIQNKK